MLLKIYDRVRPLIFGLAICFLNLVFLSNSACADELLWEIIVPVKLKNMPKEVEFVVIEWSLNSSMWGENNVFGEGSVFIPLDANSKGNFNTEETFKIYESDVSDPTKPIFIMFFLKLSKDGVTSYLPNAPGEAWTNQKKG